MLAASACGGSDFVAPTGPLTNADFAPELNVDLSAMTLSLSGLYQQDLVVGTGAEATDGMRVRAHFTGWLINGDEFDSSRGGAPFDFSLGAGEVIAGWDEGVVGMRIGGQRKLVIPPSLGFGGASLPGIPPNSTLVFDIELLDLTGL